MRSTDPTAEPTVGPPPVGPASASGRGTERARSFGRRIPWALRRRVGVSAAMLGAALAGGCTGEPPSSADPHVARSTPEPPSGARTAPEPAPPSPRASSPPSSPSSPGPQGAGSHSAASPSAAPAADAHAPSVVPRIEIRRASGSDDGNCPFVPVVHHVPAIRGDGGAFVYAPGDDSDLGEADTERLAVLKIGDKAVAGKEVASKEIALLASVSNAKPDDGTCRQRLAEARTAAQAANDTLGKHRWRALQPLAVELHDPEDFEADTPPGERKVCLYHRNGSLIVKVPGVKVLHRWAAPWKPWPGDTAAERVNVREFCRQTPLIQAFDFDPVTMQALVLITFNDGDLCLDSGSNPHVLSVPAQLVADVKRYAP